MMSAPTQPLAGTPPIGLDERIVDRPLVEELLEALRGQTAQKWREDALDLLYRDFAEEEPELQVRISEAIISSESKAMMFCKMPVRVRQHWVRRFREGQNLLV
jgi:hypothetical protein